MPPKKKKRSKSMPKQSQSQRQSVVVNIGTSKTKSKPRKSRGRGGLPPPSYQHNLAPTFVTQQATDYNPVIGAIASLTAKLNEQPRIQNPVTPLSSATSFSTQQAQSMAGQMAEERREGQTADSFVSHASQVRTETPPEEPITSKIIFTPKEKRKKKGFKPIVKLGGERKGETLDIKEIEKSEEQQRIGGDQLRSQLRLPSQADERLSMSMEDRLREADEYITQRLVPATKAGGPKEIPEAEARPLRGRPPKYIQQATPVNPLQQAQAEEPKQAQAKKKPKKKNPPAGQKDVDTLFKPKFEK
jgi:hypothetical protein